MKFLSALFIHLYVVFGLQAAHAQFQPSYATERWIEHIHVAKNFSERRRLEVDLKVLTEQGIERIAEQALSFNPKHESLRILAAHTVQADGTIERVKPDRIRIQDDADDTENGIYGENKVKLIIFPQVKVGSRLHYLAEWKRHTPEFPGHFAYRIAFAPSMIVHQAQITLSHDASLPIRVTSIGMAQAQIQAPKGEVRYQFKYQQPQAYPAEPNMLSAYDFAPRVYASSFGSWAEVARAYHDRARPKAEPDRPIKTLSQHIVEGAPSDFERARRIYLWINRNIRYLGVFSASGGYVPVPAAQVLKDRYGDCKGHATLFEAMLRSVGIESSQVLINTQTSYQWPELPIYGAFDHVITYIPSLRMYLDATSRFVRFGALPSGLEGKPVLLTATGEVSRTSPTAPTDDQTSVRTQLRLLPDGRVLGQSLSTQTGYYEQASRNLIFKRQHRPKDRVVQEILSQNKETGSGSLKHPDPNDLDASWAIEAEFELDPVINMQGLAALQIPVGLTPGRFQILAQVKAESQRRFPKACGSYTHQERIAIELPAEAKLVRLPTPRAHSSTSLTYQSNYEREGHQIILTRHFQAHRPNLVCGAEDDQDFEAFSRVIRQDLRQQLFFEMPESSAAR